MILNVFATFHKIIQKGREGYGKNYTLGNGTFL